MLPARVDEMLKHYREYSGRCKFLEQLLKVLECELQLIKDHLAEDIVSIGGQEMDGMPHGTGVGKPTERAGILLADGYQSAHMVEKQAEIDIARKEYNEKISTVVFVDAWLKGLTEREKWIIESQVIDGVTWREIMSQYPIKFGESRTKRSLQMLKDRAINKIYDMAS